MNAFWDTSAVLALLFEEPHSAKAVEAARRATASYAWAWLEVETWAGFHRRGGTRTQEASCKRLLSDFSWISFPPEKHPALLALNRRHRLRAGDIGHLYCLRELSRAVGNLTLVCFDEEIVRSARKEGIAVFS